MSEPTTTPVQEELKVTENAEAGVPQMTEAEMKVARGRRMNWYKEQTLFLKAEAEYREVQERIEVSKARILEAQYKQVQIYAAMNPDTKEEVPAQEIATTPTPTVEAE